MKGWVSCYVLKCYVSNQYIPDLIDYNVRSECFLERLDAKKDAKKEHKS